MSKKVKIFFTFSSRGLEEKKLPYLKIANNIEKNYEIIHKWYNDYWTAEWSSEEIFERVLQGIRDSDIVIAEASIGSTGVGQQIQIAIDYNIPVIILYKKQIIDKQKFFLGTPESDQIYFIPYTRILDITQVLPKIISKAMVDRYEKFNFVSTKEINSFLDKISTRKKISKSALLRRIIKKWMNTNP